MSSKWGKSCLVNSLVVPSTSTCTLISYNFSLKNGMRVTCEIYHVANVFD